MRQTNEKRRYNVTSSLAGRVHKMIHAEGYSSSTKSQQNAGKYRQNSNISRTKAQLVNVTLFVLQLSLNVDVTI